MRPLLIAIVLCACGGCQMRGRGYAPEPPPRTAPPDAGEEATRVVVPERRPGPVTPSPRRVPAGGDGDEEGAGFTAPPVERRPGGIPSVIHTPPAPERSAPATALDAEAQRAFARRCADLGTRAPAVYREGDAVAVRDALAGIDALRRRLPGYLAALEDRGLADDAVERHLAGLGFYRLLRLEQLLRDRAAELAGD